MKSQSSLEFLASYGWMIIIILIAGLFLYNLGVFDAGFFTGMKINGLSNFQINDAMLDESGNFSMVFAAKSQEFFMIKSMEYEVEGYLCSANDSNDFRLSKSMKEVAITPTLKCSIEKGKAKIKLKINYESSYGLNKTEYGSIELNAGKEMNPSSAITGFVLAVENIQILNVTNESAIIYWDNNEGISQKLVISGLSPQKTYDYGIETCEGSNCLSKGVFNFTTLYEQGIFYFSAISQSDFNEGQYINTTWGSVMLESSKLIGNYISKVFDAGLNAVWENINWGQPMVYKNELPKNQANEYGINMQGNVLLLRLNNDSNYFENNSHFYDFSGNNNNASCINCPTPVNNGVISGAISSSLNNYLTSSPSNAFNLGNNITLSLWFKCTHNHGTGSSETAGRMINLHRSNPGTTFSLLVGSDGLGYYNSGMSAFRSDGVNPCNGQWTHGAVTIDSQGTVRLYKNGALARQDSGGGVTFSNHPLHIGSYDGLTRFFVGQMDEVAIWNRTLSANEISIIHKLGALKMNLSVRSCDDMNCIGESWSNAYNDSFNQDLAIPNNQYFQFKFDFESLNLNHSPILNNASIKYKIE